MATQFVNNAGTTLSAGISSSATSLTVSSGTGFPSAGDFYVVVGTEVMKVTAVSGTTWTVVRGERGTVAASHSSGDIVVGGLTMYASVFGAKGDGTTPDTQAIQNAIAAAQAVGGTVMLEAGRVYKVGVMRINAPVTFDGAGSTILSYGLGTGQVPFKIESDATLKSSTMSGAAISKGTTTVPMSVSTSLVAAGDLCGIGLGNDPEDTTLPHWYAIVKVLANTGSSVTIDKVVPYDILTPGAGYIEKIDRLAENVTLRNLVIDTKTAQTVGLNQAGAISAFLGRNLNIENIRLYGSGIGVFFWENARIVNVCGTITDNNPDQQHALRAWKTDGIWGDNLAFNTVESAQVIFFESQVKNARFGRVEIDALSTTDTQSAIALSADSSVHIDYLRIAKATGSGVGISYEQSRSLLSVGTLDYSGPDVTGFECLPRTDRIIYNGVDYGQYKTARVRLPVDGNQTLLSSGAIIRRARILLTQLPTTSWTGYFGNSSYSPGLQFQAGVTSANVWYDVPAPMGTWFGNGDINNLSVGDRSKRFQVAVGSPGDIPTGTEAIWDIDYWPFTSADLIVPGV